MSRSVDEERQLMSFEYRNERAKRILRQLMSVQGLYLDGLSVTLIAQRLSMKKDRVYFLLRVLELTTAGRSRSGAGYRAGHLYTLKVPPIGESHAA